MRQGLNRSIACQFSEYFRGSNVDIYAFQNDSRTMMTDNRKIGHREDMRQSEKNRQMTKMFGLLLIMGTQILASINFAFAQCNYNELRERTNAFLLSEDAYMMCSSYRDPPIVIDPRNQPPQPKREIYFEIDSEKIDRQSLPYLIENITKTNGEDRFFRGIMFTSFCALERLYRARISNDDIAAVVTEYFNEHGLYNNFPYPLKKEIQKIVLNKFPEVVCEEKGEESCCTFR